MSTMRQIEPVAYLPPSNEAFLEIQVSNFIKDFLFSGADDCKTAVPSSTSRHDKNIPAKSQLVVQPPALEGYGSFGQRVKKPTSTPGESPSKVDSFQQNAAVFVDIPSQASIWTDKITSACQTTSVSGSSENGRISDGSTGSEETRIKVNAQSGTGKEVGTETLSTNPSWIHSGNWIKTALGKVETRSEGGANPVSGNNQAIAMEGREGKMMDSTQICRAETFPCKSKTQKERQLFRNSSNGTHDIGTEIKHSCRKPPRPPPLRLTRQPSDRTGCPSLTRCASDTSLFLQSCRKTKTDRRRKMAAGSYISSATPFWALIFTVCFAVAIILQGVSSQGSRILAMTYASSPAGSKTSLSVYFGARLRPWTSTLGGLKVSAETCLHAFSSTSRETRYA